MPEEDESGETELVKHQAEEAVVFPRESLNLDRSVDELQSAMFGLLQSVRSQMAHLEDEIKRLKKIEAKLTTPHA